MNITRQETPNQYELDGDIKALILHTTLGSFDGAMDWLTTSPEERERKTGVKSYSSAHFVIGRNGEVTQLAGLDKGTWHAGAISNPTKRALDVLPKTIFGTLKNPNLSTIGIEFAAGYDIDRDGVLEEWEELFTPTQIKTCVQLILTVIEPALGKTFSASNILAHRDVTDYKEALTMQRAMVVAELEKQRAALAAGIVIASKPASVVSPSAPVAVTEMVIENGGKLIFEKKGGDDKIFIRKA